MFDRIHQQNHPGLECFCGKVFKYKFWDGVRLEMRIWSYWQNSRVWKLHFEAREPSWLEVVSWCQSAWALKPDLSVCDSSLHRSLVMWPWLCYSSCLQLLIYKVGTVYFPLRVIGSIKNACKSPGISSSRCWKHWHHYSPDESYLNYSHSA